MNEKKVILIFNDGGPSNYLPGVKVDKVNYLQFFLSSLQVDSMMYPRLILSDNMEDKGLEQGRAEKFQRTVVRLLKEMELEEKKKLTTDHTLYTINSTLCEASTDYKLYTLNYQLIYATSMIAPELDTEEYVIGDYYTEDNKSLKNV